MKYAFGCVCPALCWQALPRSWMERRGRVPTSLPYTLCPASQLQPSCTKNWPFEVKMCPPVPLPALMWGGNLGEQKGPKSWQQWDFQLPPRDSLKPTCRDLDLILTTETFACLAMKGRCTLSSLLGDRLWEMPERDSPYSYLPMEKPLFLKIFLSSFEQTEYSCLGH